MVWMIKSCKESTVAAFWSQEYSRVRFHCSQNLADPVSCATKVDLAYPCHLLPSDYIWPTSSISQLQVKDTICSCLFTVHHEPRAVLQQCQTQRQQNLSCRTPRQARVRAASAPSGCMVPNTIAMACNGENIPKIIKVLVSWWRVSLIQLLNLAVPATRIELDI